MATNVELIIQDGFEAGPDDECPYDANSEEFAIRASRILWNRGKAFRLKGLTLENALDSEFHSRVDNIK